MNLVFFWIKIFIKRLINAIKEQPIIFIFPVILIAAIIIGNVDIVIELNSRVIMIMLVSLVTLSIITSFKNYRTISSLILFSKSNKTNKYIKFRFFLRNAILNNIFLILIILFSFNKNVSTENYAIMPITAVFSIIVSFLVMYTKDSYLNKKVARNNIEIVKLKPRLKGLIYDYLTSEFVLLFLFSISLLVFFILEILPEIELLHGMENKSSILTGTIIILAISSLSINGSIEQINWKFYAIINPCSFSYHVKRSLLFIFTIGGILIITLGLIVLQLGLEMFIKYLFCMVVLFYFSIYNSFAYGNVIAKIVKPALFTILIIFFANIHIVLLLVILAPLYMISNSAKNDFKDKILL